MSTELTVDIQYGSSVWRNGEKYSEVPFDPLYYCAVLLHTEHRGIKIIVPREIAEQGGTSIEQFAFDKATNHLQQKQATLEITELLEAIRAMRKQT